MKDLESILRQIAADKAYHYLIGEQHWQNLLDAEDDLDMPFEEKRKYLMFFSERDNSTITPNGGLASGSFEGTFLLAVRSSMADPNFKYKYDNHLNPLKELARELRDNEFRCLDDLRLGSYNITAWRENYLDTNLDCVEVRVRLDKKW